MDGLGLRVRVIFNEAGSHSAPRCLQRKRKLVSCYQDRTPISLLQAIYWTYPKIHLIFAPIFETHIDRSVSLDAILQKLNIRVHLVLDLFLRNNN